MDKQTMSEPKVDVCPTCGYPHHDMTLTRDLAAAREQLADTKRSLQQFISLAKAQGIQITMIECGDAAMKEKPHG